MPLPDTQMLIDKVEKKTGYGVSIVVDDKITTHAGMVSASSLSPMHTIKVNRSFAKGSELRTGLRDWFVFYRRDRFHQSLDNQTPDEVYFDTPPPFARDA